MDQSQTSIFELAIGRPAMMGFMFLLLSYLVSGQIIPGLF
tara:strand:+ start:407 stop:526 length:120 start_codon:yes stop_codon:yes gene_type:complete